MSQAKRLLSLLTVIVLPIGGLPVGDGISAAQQQDFVLPPPGRVRVSLEILVAGTPLPTIRYQGKTYLPVPTLGTEYTIRVSNHGPRRIVALVSVDGLSVINGQLTAAANPGYVVAAYGHIQIKGWRRDLERVAAFRFVEREQSYA